MNTAIKVLQRQASEMFHPMKEREGGLMGRVHSGAG